MGLGTQGCMSETRTLFTRNQFVHFKPRDEVILGIFTLAQILRVCFHCIQFNHT